MELSTALILSLTAAIGALIVFHVLPAVIRKRLWRKAKTYTLPPKFYWLDESGTFKEITPLEFMKKFTEEIRQKPGGFGIGYGYAFMVPAFRTEITETHIYKFDESGTLKEVPPEDIPKEIIEAFRRELIQRLSSEIKLTKPQSRAVQILSIAIWTLGLFTALLIMYLLLP